MSRSLTFLILQSGVTLIPHHLGLENLLYRARGRKLCILILLHRALFCWCLMRDHVGMIVKVGLERAALDSTK